jgi:hypothetical protein
MSLNIGRTQLCATVKKIAWACLLFWFYIAAAMDSRAWGQTAVDGALNGFVVDSTGAGLVGSVVEILNLADGATSKPPQSAKAPSSSLI